MAKRIINFTTTVSPEWKDQCVEWAKTDQAFRVYGIDDKNRKFCDEISRKHKLTFKFDNDSTVTFEPENLD